PRVQDGGKQFPDLNGHRRGGWQRAAQPAGAATDELPLLEHGRASHTGGRRSVGRNGWKTRSLASRNVVPFSRGAWFLPCAAGPGGSPRGNVVPFSRGA